MLATNITYNWNRFNSQFEVFYKALNINTFSQNECTKRI